MRRTARSLGPFTSLGSGALIAAIVTAAGCAQSGPAEVESAARRPAAPATEDRAESPADLDAASSASSVEDQPIADAAAPGEATLAAADATDGDASAAGTTATDAAADTAELAETEIAAAGPEIPDPQPREAAKPVVEQYSASVPRVMLSAAHRALCRVGVGDALPTIELPQASGGSASIDSLAGSKATVVLFWTSDPWMSRTALADVQRDVVDRLAGDAVRAVGVAVGDVGDAPVEVRFPQLIDADGSAFAQVGEQALPRIYVLDGQRRIAWFDIEYSESSRRELRATLAALAADGAN